MHGSYNVKFVFFMSKRRQNLQVVALLKTEIKTPYAYSVCTPRHKKFAPSRKTNRWIPHREVISVIVRIILDTWIVRMAKMHSFYC
jgi:hypothetical protein